MNQSTNKMAVRPVFPLLMSMALPPMFSMLLSSLYNIVDSMFVARYSADALTAVSLAFPLQNFCIPTLFQAVGRGRSSLVIFLLRQFLITLPLAWLLAGPFGLTGIWLSFLAAESVAALAALVMLARLLRADPILHAENPAA